jgi:hypothetical protein
MTSGTLPVLSVRPGRASYPSAVVIAGAIGVAMICGAVISTAPKYALAGLVVVPLALLVWWRPAVAGYLIVGVTPLVVGIDRGRLIPALRPNEALVFFLVGVLVTRLLVRVWIQGQHVQLPKVQPVELSLIALAVTSSFLPLGWMVVRGLRPSGDDFSYALVLWKYLIGYAIVRFTVSSNRDVRRCLSIIQVTSALVGAIAILQALDMFGVRAILAQLYSPLGDLGALDLARAGSTLSLPAATADLMIVTMAISVGLWLNERRHGVWHSVVLTTCVLAVFAAGEFSSVLGLVVAAVSVAVVLRRRDVIVFGSAAVLIGIVFMWPIVSTRLQGFESASGWPVSWVGRWRNLTTYFWPQLFSGQGWNVLFGVRPAARVPVASQATGFVWIESGYTWLLWGGGFPLVASFIAFVYTGLRLTARAARTVTTSIGAAALGASSGLVVTAVLMIFDPHLTYRGFADCLLALLAMCAAAATDGRLRQTGANRHRRQASSITARSPHHSGPRRWDSPGSHNMDRMAVSR